MSEKFTYEVNEKKYIQKKLVWGQVEQLNQVLIGMVFPANLSPINLMGILGTNLPNVCAVILTEEGTKLQDKDLDALITEFKFNLDMDLSLDIITDFFDCTPVDSLLSKLTGLAKKFTEGMNKKSVELTESSLSLQEETLPEVEK